MPRKKIVENVIYASIIEYCEGREGKPVGNGHHMAQDLTTLVSIGLLAKNKRKIFDALTKEPQAVKDISKTTGLSSKSISSTLIQMDKTTLLVHFKKVGRLKKWYK